MSGLREAAQAVVEAAERAVNAPVYEQPHTPRSEGGTGFISTEFATAMSSLAVLLPALRAALAAPAPAVGCGECMGWPGHHPDCSQYGEPRTEAGRALLRMIEGGLHVSRDAIVAIEDEAEVRAANKAAPAPHPCIRCGTVLTLCGGIGDRCCDDCDHPYPYVAIADEYARAPQGGKEPTR